MTELADATSPMIDISVELPPALAESFARGGWREPLRAAISRVAAELVATLGVPGRSAVALEGRDGVEEPFRVRVQGTLCRHDTDFLNELQSFFLRRLPPNDAKDARVTEWLFELAKGSAAPESAPGRQLIEFVATACRELLQRKPSRLLGEAHAEAYRQRLLSHWPDAPTDATLRHWLGEVLDFGLAITDTPKIAAVLQEGLRQKHDPHELAEDLIAALQPEEIEIRLATGYLRVLTEDDVAPEEKLFALMRDGLFYELGLTFPRFRFVIDAQLPLGCFAFKLNHRVTLPRQGLAPTEILANDTMESLRLLGVQALAATVNPANRTSGSVLNSAEIGRAVQAGVTTWTPLGYLILCLSSELRQHAAALLSGGAAGRAFEQLSQTFPELIAAARERLSVSRLSRVLRELLAEEVCVRNLPRIIQTILDYDYVLADEARQIIFDERIAFRDEPPSHWNKEPVLLAASVRRAFKRYISHKYTRGQSTMSTYLLDPQIEKQLSGHASGTAPLTEADVERLISAARSEIKPLQGSTPPTVLTSTEARRPFRELIGPVYPWLPVLAYQELSPELNIQVIERITMKD